MTHIFGPTLGFGVVVAAAAISWLLTSAVRSFALRRGFLDHPNARSSHTHATPRGGGIAIVTIVTATVAALFASSTVALTYVAAAVSIALISAVDDFGNLPAFIRLFVHAVAAVLLTTGAGSIAAITLPLVGMVPLGLMAFPFTVLWLVAVTNGYNFMDGIDGIAAGQAVIAGLAWAVIGFRINASLVVAIGLLTAGASAGFLVLNWSPAKVFMGDVGSAFLGFTFAAMPMLVARKSAELFVPAALILWPFLFDTALTLLARARRGENIFAAHRSHLYQRLARATQSHAGVSLLYTTLAAGGALCVFRPFPEEAIAGGVIVAGLALWAYVGRVERLAGQPHAT